MAHRSGPWRKLDEQEIAELRRLRDNDGWSGLRLAQHYGVSLRTVQRYLVNKPSPATMRVGAIVDRWAWLYALDLRPQERDTLVAMLCSPTVHHNDRSVPSVMDSIEAAAA